MTETRTDPAEPIADFLASVAPFDSLGTESLAAVVSQCTIETFPSGASILVQGSPPSRYAWVIRDGAVELADQGRVVDVLGRGEMFGHRSIVTGEPVSLDVRAARETVCCRIPEAALLPVLNQPSALRHLVLSVSGRYEMRARERLVEAEASQRPVRDLVDTGVVVCTPGSSVRDVARQMSDRNSPVALVELGTAYGVVTDRDLRARVVAAGAAGDTAVDEVMTTPARVVEADRLGSDVLLEMLETGIERLPVIDERGTVLGLVTSTDLITASVRTPFKLRTEIMTAADEPALAEAAARLPQAALELSEARVSAPVISGVLTSAHDALTRRLIDLAQADLGPAPAPFTWFTLGSFARREAFLDSDQDNAIAWDAPVEDDVARAWMEALAARVVGGLEAAGIKPCNGGALATKRLFARPIADWERLARSWLDDPDQEKALILVSLVGDGRAIYGGDVAGARMRRAFSEAQNRPRLLRLLEQFALADRPPTGFRRDLIVEHDGEHRGTLDIKKGGLLPIVDLARSAALAAGVTAASTPLRLDAARHAGTIPPPEVSVLHDAFALVTDLRMKHQIEQLRNGQTPDNHIDPTTLTPLVRTYLKDAFRAVARVQRGLKNSMSTGQRLPA